MLVPQVLSMNRRGVLAALSGAVVAVLLVSVATSGKVVLFERYPDISLERGEVDTNTDPLFGLDLGEEETEVFKIWEVDLPDLLATVLQVVLIAAAVALLISLWNRRPRLQWRKARPPEDFDVLDDLARLVAADAAAQRTLLAVGTPRNAIVACWLRLEALTAEAGFERDPADTSEEFTSRILHQFAIDPFAVDRLAGLYREARFSSHPMGEADRAAAIDTLDAVHSGLRQGAEVQT